MGGPDPNEAEWKLFPAAFQWELKRAPANQHTRIVTDYVSGMTEKEIKQVYATLCGFEPEN